MLVLLRRLLLTAVLLTALPAFAVSTGYGFENGQVVVTARRSSDGSVVFSELLNLGETSVGSSYVLWDPDGVPTGFGQGSIDDLFMEVTPSQGPFSLVAPYGPFDTVQVEYVSIAAGPGFATTVSVPQGGGSFNPVSAGVLDVNAFYGASHSSGVPPPVTGVRADIVGFNALTGFVTTTGQDLQIHIVGALMGTLDGTPFGEIDDLEITGDITWLGSQGAFVPEPTTGSLLGLGLVGMALRRRGSRPS